jgi:hypothetical protein
VHLLRVKRLNSCEGLTQTRFWWTSINYVDRSAWLQQITSWLPLPISRLQRFSPRLEHIKYEEYTRHRLTALEARGCYAANKTSLRTQVNAVAKLAKVTRASCYVKLVVSCGQALSQVFPEYMYR